MKYVKFLITLAVCLCIAWAIHALAFTIYAVTDDGLAPEINRGNRVIVNRLASVTPQKGDLLVYTDSTYTYLGKVLNLPGDTIKLENTFYLIPEECCDRCLCPDCKLYFMKTSQGFQLVYKHQLVGKAYLLF